jgi:acetoin utilization deacetylase AcuC-like enzyme
MVVDLDVHQGNGVERDKLHWNDADLCIVDM